MKRGGRGERGGGAWQVPDGFSRQVVNRLKRRHSRPIVHEARHNNRLEPSHQFLQNRREVREAERELAATGLDVASARARFYPRFDISASVAFVAF